MALAVGRVGLALAGQTTHRADQSLGHDASPARSAPVEYDHDDDLGDDQHAHDNQRNQRSHRPVRSARDPQGFALIMREKDRTG